MNAYTVWVAHGRIGTYKTPEKAEEIRQKVIDNIEDLVRIQTWTPEPHHEAYVTFDDEEPIIKDT
jgi:hypothetical protein